MKQIIVYPGKKMEFPSALETNRKKNKMNHLPLLFNPLLVFCEQERSFICVILSIHFLLWDSILFYFC